MAFSSLGNSDHVSVSIDFPSNSKGDALLHRIANILRLIGMVFVIILEMVSVRISSVLLFWSYFFLLTLVFVVQWLSFH